MVTDRAHVSELDILLDQTLTTGAVLGQLTTRRCVQAHSSHTFTHSLDCSSNMATCPLFKNSQNKDLNTAIFPVTEEMD